MSAKCLSVTFQVKMLGKLKKSKNVCVFSVPGRFATLILFITLMFMYVCYSANIVALLQTSSNSIKTLEDLLSSRIPLGVDDTVFNHFFFTVSV